MKGFLLSFRSEFYKSRKTPGFWGAIILPLAITLLVSIGFFVKSEKFVKSEGMVLWLQYAGISLGIMGTLLLPIYSIFVAYSVNNIEHRADTWKTLFSLPISRWSVYAAKYLYALFLVFLCMMLFALFTIGLGNLLSVLKPELRFNTYHMELEFFQIYFKLFLSALGILSLQFLMSLLWSDFLKPMGIGFVLTIVGLIVGKNWEYSYMLPYSHPFLALQSMFKNGMGGSKRTPTILVDIFTKDVFVSLIIAVVVFILGYFIVAKRSVK